jgi:Acetyltransferase (GNAT) domain
MAGGPSVAAMTMAARELPRPVAAAVRTTVMDPLNDPAWDVAVVRHPAAGVFHTTAWAGVLNDAYGLRPFYVVASHEDEPVGLLPLMEASSLRGRRRGVSLPFTDSCPALLPAGGAEPDFVEANEAAPAGISAVGAAMMREARATGLGRGWKTVEFRPNPTRSATGGASVRFLWHEVLLPASDDDQLALCAPATRRTLRQAMAAGVKTVVGTDLGMVRAYYRLHCLTRRRQGGPPQPFAFFAAIQRRLLEAGCGFVVLATENGAPVAGAVYLTFGGQAVYKFGASDPDRLKNRPNQLVMWTGLRESARRGCRTLNMGRTSLDNEGLAQFKRGWGCVSSYLAYHAFNLQNSSRVPLPDRTQGWQTRWFQRLPLWVGRWVGILAYRYAA